MTENLKKVSGKEFLSFGPSLYVWLLVHDAWESESPSGDQAISDLLDVYLAGQRGRPHCAVGLCRALASTCRRADVAAVFEFGADKYEPRNFRKAYAAPTQALEVYASALMRHVLMAGNLDEESGLPHEAHACACAMILLDMELSLLSPVPVAANGGGAPTTHKSGEATISIRVDGDRMLFTPREAEEHVAEPHTSHPLRIAVHDWLNEGHAEPLFCFGDMDDDWCALTVDQVRDVLQFLDVEDNILEADWGYAQKPSPNENCPSAAAYVSAYHSSVGVYLLDHEPDAMRAWLREVRRGASGAKR